MKKMLYSIFAVSFLTAPYAVAMNNGNNGQDDQERKEEEQKQDWQNYQRQQQIDSDEIIAQRLQLQDDEDYAGQQPVASSASAAAASASSSTNTRKRGNQAMSQDADSDGEQSAAASASANSSSDAQYQPKEQCIRAGCSICLEDHKQGTMKTPCGHLFHWSCINKWINDKGHGNGKCPNCGCTLTSNNIPYLQMFLDAIFDEDEISVRDIIQNVPNIVTCATKCGVTGLYSAVECRNRAMVQLLLEKGANVNAAINDPSYPSYGKTPLHVAVENGDIAIVQLLIAAHADINAQEAQGCTALYVAAAVGNQEIVQCLISAGADVDIRDNHGITALHVALFYDKDHVAEILLQNGADVNACNCEGGGPRPLWLAIQKNNQAMIDLLLKYGAVE